MNIILLAIVQVIFLILRKLNVRTTAEYTIQPLWCEEDEFLEDCHEWNWRKYVGLCVTIGKLLRGEAKVLSTSDCYAISVLCMLIDLQWLISYSYLEAFGKKCHWATALKGGIFGYLIGIWYNLCLINYIRK